MQEYQDLIDAIQEALDVAMGCEFPGMFG
jgi:hypothetical protein